MTDNLLSRDEIFAADDIKFAVVDVPEWGGKVRLKGLTGAERDRYEAAAVTVKPNGDRIVDPKNLRAKLLVLSIVDAQGLRMFTEDDMKALGRKSAAALERCFDAARHLSGMTEEDMARLEQDFDNGQSEDSSIA